MAGTLQLLQTLNARICHDLAGSIGIIDNCLDLLDTKDKSISQKAKSLVNTESGNLVKKIKIFRSVYGRSDGEKEMSAVYLTKLMKDFFDGNGIKPKLHFEEGIIFLDAHIAKASICLTILASENIHSNGTIDLFFSKDNVIKIIANDRNLNLRKDNLNVLKRSGKIPITVNNCREHYVNILCDKSGYDLIFDEKEDSFRCSLVKR